MEFTINRAADVPGTAVARPRAHSVRVAGILAVGLCFLAGVAGAKDEAPLVLPAGSRIGIVNLLSADLSYYYYGTTIFQNKLKTFPVDWNIPGYFDSLLQQALTERGYEPVIIKPSAFLQSHRTDLYASSGFFTTDDIDRLVPDEIAAWVRDERLSAIIVVSTEADKTFKIGSGFWSARYATFPDLMVDWGVIVKNPLVGKPIPYVYNATAPMLIDLAGGDAKTLRIGRGSSELIEWKDSGIPDDARDLALTDLAAARPLLEQAIGRQIDGLMKGVGPATGPAMPSSEARPAEPPASAVPATDAPATDAPPADAAPTESPKPADQP